MCDPVSLLVLTAGGAIGAAGLGMYASIQSANANAKAAKYEALMQEKQLYRQREQQRIASAQAEVARSTKFEQSRSAALAAIGASGLGEHISFFQAADPTARKNYLRDVQTIRLNMTAQNASIADQVGVTEFKKDINVFNQQMAKVGAVADFIQTSMQAVSQFAGAGG